VSGGRSPARKPLEDIAARASIDVYQRSRRPLWLVGLVGEECDVVGREERMAFAPSRCRRQERGRSAPEWISHMQSVSAVARTASRIGDWCCGDRRRSVRSCVIEDAFRYTTSVDCGTGVRGDV